LSFVVWGWVPVIPALMMPFPLQAFSVELMLDKTV
jgi:hypothetical protein